MELFDDTSLFTSEEKKIVRYDLVDAELILYKGFFSKTESDFFYYDLFNNTNWKQEDITVYGQTHLTPRLTAWYGDEDKSYTFSGTRWRPETWTKSLRTIKDKIEEQSGYQFNSVLLNLYRSGKDGVGWHRDNEKEFGENPVIASVSFGETRLFQLRHKFKKEVSKIEIPLTHGSFLLMTGSTQHFWEHQVPKTAKQIRPRINLTYRMIKH